jgi:hypothetical protein
MEPSGKRDTCAGNEFEPMFSIISPILSLPLLADCYTHWSILFSFFFKNSRFIWLRSTPSMGMPKLKMKIES